MPTDDIKPLPTVVYVSDEEYEHVLDVLASPEGPSPSILRGAELLRKLRGLRDAANQRRFR
jgi:uncharacterized protein (DUF1778 family)